jgi:hypothetical protein
MTQHLLLNRFRAFHQRFWYIGDLIVIGLLSAYIAYVHSFYSISYHAGLHHNGVARFVAAMRIAMWLPVVAILLLVLIYRLTISWSKHIGDPKRRWKLRGLVLALLGLYAGLFFAAIRSSAEGLVLGLLRYGQTSVDVPAIQTRLKTIAPEDCLGDRLGIYIGGLPEAEQATWPQAVKSLKPQQVRVPGCRPSPRGPPRMGLVGRGIWDRDRKQRLADSGDGNSARGNDRGKRILHTPRPRAAVGSGSLHLVSSLVMPE